MAILAECDICGAQHRVKDAWNGRTMACKECGTPIPVLDDNTITPENYIEERGRLRRRQAEDADPGWYRLVPILAALAVGLTLASAIWLISVIIHL
ncbi:hypothetical protein [Schlesneria sp. DSM 10557]|uniref:hypothetical protein n=1 Tax=Schlesneria sp. DSM 10557 TaxID=3044399 RepID=UPI00359F22AE